ncbi:MULTISPECIES: hypothetical protein [Thiorhodovibrio]|uniref:hypothetical protein n=1 Tax=Thiorhodovibrio TaxID=61593 RepID=UPI001911B6F7|nr:MULTISPECIES: hypothetical protein [Thiorhodovibrio]MBK5970717.1 hypothetical protein [Thiorhodovibrio winogradskyi]WPL14262.1 hypothetical protein Thiosp_04097 [Thiorhodovibrio litoralis]
MSALDLVLCRAAGHCFGFEAALVRQAQNCGSAAVTSLETCLGLPEDGTQDRHLLSLRGCNGDWTVDVAGPLELTSLPFSHIHPLPPLLALQPPLPGLRALALVPPEEPKAPRAPQAPDARLILLLDPRTLALRASNNSLTAVGYNDALSSDSPEPCQRS